MVEWSEDELHDDEYPDEEDDSYDEDDTLTVPCPECGSDVYEDAQQCPVCGSYITHRHSPLAGRSLGWIILGLLGTLAVLVALLRGG